VTRRVDTVVIGAGAMGASTAWWLARQRRSVVLAEQFEAGHRRGSSHGGVRIFRHAYPDPMYVRMTVQALRWWRELEDDCGETLLELVGALDHGPAGELDAIVGAMRAAGAWFEVLSPDAAAERHPGMRFAGHVLAHEGGRCYADRTVAALVRRTGELGGEVRFECPARVVAVGEHEAEVDLGGDTVVASTVVLTAGAWITEVLPTAAAITLPPLEVTQEQVLHFQPLDPATVWPSFIHHIDPLRYGVFTPGEGLKVGGHHEGPATTAGDRTFELDAGRVEAIRAYVRQWLPGVADEPQFGATCLYTTTPDESFVMERRGPIVVGSTCSGHGFKFTPLIGHRLAELAAGD
jgi:sarcosine oxidase